jgi:hypothetical protein
MMNKKLNAAITDLVLGKLPPEEASRLLDAIARNSKLSSVLETTIELQCFSQGRGKTLYEDRIAPASSSRRRADVYSRRERADRPWGRRVVPVTLLISFAIMCLVVRNATTIRDTLDDPGGAWISWASQRSDTNSDLVYAEMLVKTGEYQNALRVLMRHMRSHQKDALHGQVQYNAAVVTLFLAREEVFGIWLRNDPVEVRAGVMLLDSVALNQNPVALRNRAIYLRAKARLAIGDDSQAINELMGLSSVDQEYKESVEALMAKVKGR